MESVLKIINKKTILLAMYLCLIGLQTSIAQEVKHEAQKAFRVSKPSKVEHVPPMATRMRTLESPDLTKAIEAKDGRSVSHKALIGKGSKGDDVLAKKPHKLKASITANKPELVFETAISTYTPTDPTGAVGPNHYFTTHNKGFQIFDKTGKSLTGGVKSPTPAIFPTDGCCDMTISYDNNADRWVLSMLIKLNGGVQVAVSDGPDPINDGWTVYTFSEINDYQKLSVWRDGYYMTDNDSLNPTKIHVFERSAMIDDPSAGTTPRIVSFTVPGLIVSGGVSPQVLNISNFNWPTSGGATIVYMQDDAWEGVLEDNIKLWTIDMDWINISNSTISAPQKLGAAEGVTPFAHKFGAYGGACLTQPGGGTDLDALQGKIMNQAQFRKFRTHNSAVFNFVVDADGSSAIQAGVRWYELRQSGDGQPWRVHQEGTYTASDSKHAWNASLIMDEQGNIGMGYTSMSSANSVNKNVYAGSYFTGRYANDPLGTMTIAEELIMTGSAKFTYGRYGDYSKIDIDPANDKKFWFVNEIKGNKRKNVAGVFQIAPDVANDIGVIHLDAPLSGALGTDESITVTIFNYGQNPASNFEVNYQIDGGTKISETYAGPAIPSNQAAQFTFATKADLSTIGHKYSIAATTNQGSDEDNTNNQVTEQLTHKHPNDIGVSAILTPFSKQVLGAEEPITVVIKNYGTASQSNFDVSYSINGGTAVVDRIAGPLAPGSWLKYTFTTKGDFSGTTETYIIDAETSLSSDNVAKNNNSEITLKKASCVSETNVVPQVVGPNKDDITKSDIYINTDMPINDVNVTVNIEHTWANDLDVKLIGPNWRTEVVLFNDVGGGEDNFINTAFDDDANTGIENGAAPFTGTFKPQGRLRKFIDAGLSSKGNWRLYIEDDQDGDGGNLISWFIELCNKKTLFIEENNLEGDFKILNDGNNQFEITLSTTALSEDLDLYIYDALGQSLLWDRIRNENGTYRYDLNMSYASPGVYIIRLGDNSVFATKRIIVK